MKYTLTNETKLLYGRTLHRIKALKDFSDVSKGDLGGWIEKETNLSQNGMCWVFGDAKVFGDANVYDNARVYGNARVSGNAKVCGTALVSHNAKVSGNALVYDNARVYGNARVYDDAIATKTVKNIIGLPYNITITDNHIQIGCKQFTFDKIIKLDKNWTKLKTKYDTNEVKQIEPYRKIIVKFVKLEMK